MRGPATPEQLEELRALADAEVVGGGVRERVLARLDQGLNMQQATDAVAYLRRLHRQAERSGGGGEVAA